MNIKILFKTAVLGLAFGIANTGQIQAAMAGQRQSELLTITTENTSKPKLVGEPEFTIAIVPRFAGADRTRRFYAELVTNGANPEVVVDPAYITFLDSRTLMTALTPGGEPLGEKREVKRFYFETCQAGETHLTFKDKSGEIIAPLTIWGTEELIAVKEVNGMVIPRIFPMNKDRASFFKHRQVDKVVPQKGGEISGFNYGKRRGGGFDIEDTKAFTLDEMWSHIVDVGAMGRFVGMGPDPVHPDSRSQYRKKALMPIPGQPDSLYILSPHTKDDGKKDVVDEQGNPAGRKIPDNDWVAGDFSSGEVIDDGFNGIEVNGVRHLYVGHLGAMRNGVKLLQNFERNYLNTSDPAYLVRAMILLTRIAQEKMYVSTMPHLRRGHGWRTENHTLLEATENFSDAGNCGLILDGIQTMGSISKLVKVYDALFPYFGDAEDELLAFLKQKGVLFGSIAEWRQYVETGVFLTTIQSILDGTTVTNYPKTEEFFIEFIRLMDYPGNHLLELVYKGDGEGTWPAGFMYQGYGRGFLRDQVKFESCGGYNKLANGRTLSLMQKVSAYVAQKPDASPEYKDLSQNRRLLTAVESHIEHAILPHARFSIGDSQGVPVYGLPAGTKSTRNWNKLSAKKADPKTGGPKRSSALFGDESPQFFAEVYNQFKDTNDPVLDKIAWVFVTSHRDFGKRLPGNLNTSMAELKARAANLPADWRSRGRLLSGHGFSILRSGFGEHERAVVTHYGSRIGHAGDTFMNFFLDAEGERLFGQWGYPPGWHKWYSSFASVNSGRQFRGDGTEMVVNDQYRNWRGDNIVNIDSGDLHVSENAMSELYTDEEGLGPNNDDGREVYKQNGDVNQKRMKIIVDVDRDGLVDNGKEAFYVLDWYRMQGGTHHWRVMSSLDGKFSTSGLKTRGGGDKSDNLATRIKGYQVPWATQGATTMGNPADTVEWKNSRIAWLPFLYNLRIDDSPRGLLRAEWNPYDHFNQKDSDLHVHMHSLNLGKVEEVIVANATPPLKSDIERDCVLWHHTGEEGFKSQSLNVIEAFRSGRNVIESIRQIKVESSGSANETYAPIGLEVTLKNIKRRDYFILSDSDQGEKTIMVGGKELTLKGRVGYLSLKGERVRDMRAIDGSSITYGKMSCSQEMSSFKATIAATDYDNWEITLDRDCLQPERLIGKHIYVLRGGVRIGFEVRKVASKGGKLAITLNSTPELLQSPQLGAKKNWLLFRKKAAMGRSTLRWSHSKHYHHAWVKGASGKAYRVDCVLPAGIRLEENVPAFEFPSGKVVTLYDYGVGDSVEIPFDLFN